MPPTHTMRLLTLAALVFPNALFGQSRLTTRALSDAAEIGIPSRLKGPVTKLPRTDPPVRVSWSFQSTYLWASMGSHQVYRQLLVVSVMPRDASEAEFEKWPGALTVSYEAWRKRERRTLGTGVVTIWSGRYRAASVDEPAHQYHYVDRARGLQIVWHAVDREAAPAQVLGDLERIAASFRLRRDLTAEFREQREEPEREARARAERVRNAREMVQRETGTMPVAGRPVLLRGVHLEWMDDPEPRYQLLVPLGRIRRGTTVATQPRGLHDATRDLGGTVGWRLHEDGAWAFTNNSNAYLPLSGIAAMLAAEQQDPAYVYFYYVGTVRVAQETDDRRLTSLRWFTDGVAEAQRRFFDGRLAGPGTPERF